MIERKEVYEKIAPFIDKPVVKVITGVRRCGKSTFMKQLIEKLVLESGSRENIIYINKELLEFEFINDYRVLYQYIKERTKAGAAKKHLFVDEIQEIQGWEKAINSILAEELADIYITGSNSTMLSSELATLLTGRYVLIPMFTLSFAEFLQFRKKDESKKDEEFELYLKYGGFPGIHNLVFEDEVVFQYLDSIYNTILLKDVVARHSIRDIYLLEKIAAFCFDNCGNITTSKKIADFFKSQHVKISPDTVQNYITYLKDSFIFHKSGRYDIKGKKHLEVSEKYYAGDIGLRHSVIGYKKTDISGLLENIVYMELLRRGYSVSTGKFDDLEVDFIAEKSGSRIYFQVTYLLASKETEEREFKPLEKINDNYPKIVLSMDKIWGDERNGMLRKNIVDFLLD